MSILTQLYIWVPYVSILLIIVGLIYVWFSKKDFIKFLKIAILLVLGIIILKYLYFVLTDYISIKNSTLGEYLLDSSYFINHVFINIQALLIQVAVAIILYILGIIFLKIQKKEYLEVIFPLVLFFSGLIFGLSNVLPGLFLMIFSAVLYQIVLKIKTAQTEKISLIPFLLISCLLIHIFSIFPVYQNILIQLRLL